MPKWVQPPPKVNAKCDVVMKLSVFGTQTDTHTHTQGKPIHPRYVGGNKNFTYLPRSSHRRISTNFCTAVEVVDVKKIFWRSIKGRRVCGEGGRKWIISSLESAQGWIAQPAATGFPLDVITDATAHRVIINSFDICCVSAAMQPVSSLKTMVKKLN